MPNYTLVNRPVFKARSFDDLVKPFALYKTEYDKVKDQQDKWLDESAKWDVIINMEKEKNPNSQFVKNYNAYKKSLENARDALLSGGLNLNTPQLMSEARAGYAASIPAMTEAREAQKKKAETEDAMRIQHPDLIIANPAMNQSLDNFAGGVPREQTHSVSPSEVGKNIYNSMALLGQKAARILYPNGQDGTDKTDTEADKWTETTINDLPEMLQEVITNTGVKPSDIYKLMEDPTKATDSEVVNNFVKYLWKTHVDSPLGLSRDPINDKYIENENGTLKSGYGYKQGDIDAVMNAAKWGLSGGLGNADVKIMEDKPEIMKKDQEYAMARIAQQNKENQPKVYKVGKDDKGNTLYGVNVPNYGFVYCDENGTPRLDENGMMILVPKSGKKGNDDDIIDPEVAKSAASKEKGMKYGAQLLASGWEHVQYEGVNEWNGWGDAPSNYTIKVELPYAGDLNKEKHSTINETIGSVKVPYTQSKFGIWAGADNFNSGKFNKFTEADIRPATKEEADAYYELHPGLYDEHYNDDEYRYQLFAVTPYGWAQNTHLANGAPAHVEIMKKKRN